MKTLDGTLYRSALDCSGLPMSGTGPRCGAKTRSEAPCKSARRLLGGGVECNGVSTAVVPRAVRETATTSTAVTPTIYRIHGIAGRHRRLKAGVSICAVAISYTQACQNRSTSERDRRTGRGQMIELDVCTLAFIKWAVMGKANPVLLFGAKNSAHFAPITAAVEQCATALGDGLQQLAKERSVHLGPIATPIR